MPAAKRAPSGAGGRVCLRRPRLSDRGEFLAGVRASGALHRDWVQAPASAAGYAKYLRRYAGARARRAAAATDVGFVVCRNEDGALVGVFNLSQIVRGIFQSAHVGYYAFAPYAGRGYMAEAFALVLKVAFRALRLHRLEVNVQPENRRSIALARGAGFRREGFSRGYVRIAGRWRDHERWALTLEDWRRQRRPAR